MAQKVLVNGTAYDLKPSPVLIDGTKYQIGGGRTLVNGTGYDIKLGHEEIWVVENASTLPAEAIGDFSAVVICDGIEYIRIEIVSVVFGIYRRLQLYKNDGTYDIYSDRVQMTFPTPPTGELLTWLETYAEKQ